MSDPLYRKEVLRLAADAHAAGRLPHPTVTGHAHNPVCGDRVTIDLLLEDGRVVGIAQDAKACVLAQAAASILGMTLNGATEREIKALRLAVAAMLEGRSAAPAPPFSDFAELAGAAVYPSRHRCILLPIEAALAAFESEPREPESVGTG